MAIKHEEILPGGVSIPDAYWYIATFSVDRIAEMVEAQLIAWKDAATRNEWKAQRDALEVAAEKMEAAGKEVRENDGKNPMVVAQAQSTHAIQSGKVGEANAAMQEACNINTSRQVRVPLSDVISDKETGAVSLDNLYAAIMKLPDWDGSSKV
jgi:hypothetical protein